MKVKIRLILFAIIIGIFSLGCSKKNEEISSDIEEVEEVEEIEEVSEELEEEIEIVEEKLGLPSPLSGLYIEDRDKINRRPVAIMFDNHPKARWQAGLKDAEIVYEFLVEFPYTRYLALYLVNDPEDIGPVRSARPYFITTSLEYDALYVHVGGSPQAKTDISNLKIADIDGLTSSNKVFWRKSHKKAPNNMYSSMDAIRSEAERRNYRQDSEYKSFKFYEDDRELEGRPANSVAINYRKDNTSAYEYDSEEKIYKRYKDGEVHIDESDNSPILAKNIIIQRADTKVIDNIGRLSINLEGSGEGIYISNGKAIDIRWEKGAKNQKTLYYMMDTNEELILNPGISWIQIVQNDTEIVLE